MPIELPSKTIVLRSLPSSTDKILINQRNHMLTLEVRSEDIAPIMHIRLEDLERLVEYLKENE